MEPCHNIFTTNYDLLLYWTVLQSGTPSHQDGFRSDEDDPDTSYVIFTERLGGTKGLFYLHGALHLYVAAGELRKHSWRRTGQRLTELIRAGLNVGEYPLFIAEGTAEKKLEQIQRNGYLWYALDKLARIESPLVVFGHSFSEGDQHIANTLADSADLPALYVGLHGDPDSERNLQIRSVVDGIARRREERERQRVESRRSRRGRRGGSSAFVVELFDSRSARPWG